MRGHSEEIAMRNWKIDLPAQLKRFARDRMGAVAVLTGLTLTTLLGFAGLGTDATLWFVAKRNLQGAADVAAFSAATAELAGANSTTFTAAAKAVSKQYGFADGVNGVSVTVNNPPASGNYTTNGEAVEVLISQPQPLFFSSLFLSTAPTATSRAVATEGASSDGCVMALDKGNVMDGVGDSGSGALNLVNCTLYVNSSSANALQLSGSASINALSAFIVGNYTMSGTSSFKATDGINTGATAVTNPYAGVKVPTFSGCNSSSVTPSSGTKSLTASTYGGTMVICGNLGVSGTASLSLGPGTYIIDSGSFAVSGTTASVTGTGVTIILTSSVGSYGTASISGTTTVTLSAPTSGPTKGIAIFQDPRASGKTNSLSGGSGQNITGALYFPNEAVSYSGGSSTSTASPCTQLIGLTLTFSGSSTFNSNCNGVGVAGVGGSASKLVE
jgi:Flp pilus assembly protein TadG